MCTYNGEAHVAEQLRSILAQTRVPDELVIFDDASTDDTVAQIRGALSSAPEVTVRLHCNAVNIGYRKNFARALEATTGDIVFYCDQDDVWTETKVERILKVFQRQPETLLVYSDAILFDDTGGDHIRLSELYEDFFHVDRRADETLKSVHKTHNIKGCLMAFHKNLRAAALPIGPGWGHDRWLTMLAHALSGAAAVREPLIHHRRHPGAHTLSFSRLADKQSSAEERSGPRTWLRTALRGNGRRKVPACRYRVLAERLAAIASSQRRHAAGATLQQYLNRAWKLADVCEGRVKLRDLPLFPRAGAATRLLIGGYYHQHFGGFDSYFDDLALRRGN